MPRERAACRRSPGGKEKKNKKTALCAPVLSAAKGGLGPPSFPLAGQSAAAPDTAPHTSAPQKMPALAVAASFQQELPGEVPALEAMREWPAASSHEASSPQGLSATASCEASSPQEFPALATAVGSQPKPDPAPPPQPPPNFLEWLRSLTPDKRNEITSSYIKYKEAEDQWNAKAAESPKKVPPRKPRSKHAGSYLRYRLSTGIAFLAWLEAEGKHSKQPLKDYMMVIRHYEGQVPKKDKVWLAGCRDLANATNEARGTLTVHGRGGLVPSRAQARTPEEKRLRSRGLQGRGYKSPEIREHLWTWFVDIRRSLATSISPRFVLYKAREIAEQVLRWQRQNESYAPLPRIDKHWLLRWKRDYGVVFRKPNARYKCSKATLYRRLRAMWLNVIRIRHLAVRCLGKDLADQIYGIDEKPIHFNEAGSKNVRTLEIAGAPEVKLKQNHAATRERASLMTCVSSNKAATSAVSNPRRLPIEILIKAKSGRRIKAIKLPEDLNVSLQWAEKGSYRQEHIVRYLERWLDPWTPEREEQADYRILMLDVAKSHIGNRIEDTCWEHGYICLYHYGCTTGVTQVNDTDLHGAFEREYFEMEQTAFNQKALYDPGCIDRSPQEVVDSAVATWRVLDHGQGASGHKRTALSVALDGTEDTLISRSALDCWRGLDMAAERLRAIAEVDAKVDAGLTFQDWRSLVQHPQDPGILREGEEFEGDQEADECPWLVEADEQLAKVDDDEVMGHLEKPAKVEIVPVADEKAAAVEEASCQATRLKLLRHLREASYKTLMPALSFRVDAEIAMIERGKRARTEEDKEAAAVLRRHLEKERAEQMAKIKKQCEETKKRKENVAKVKRLRAQEKAKKEAKKAAAAKVKAKLAALPTTWSAKDCGQKGQAGRKAMEGCLERLFTRAPPLDEVSALQWPAVRAQYVKNFPKTFKGKEPYAIGVEFIKRINSVLKELCCHYNGPTKFNKDQKDKGDPEAFAKFFGEMQKALPKHGTSVTM